MQLQLRVTCVGKIFTGTVHARTQKEINFYGTSKECTCTCSTTPQSYPHLVPRTHRVTIFMALNHACAHASDRNSHLHVPIVSHLV